MPPVLPDLDQTATAYHYNLDKQLLGITRPGGTSATLTYDAASGNLLQMTTPEGTTTYIYQTDGGRYLSQITAPDGGTLSFTYDGALITSTAWDGEIPGSVSWTFNNNFKVTSRSVNGDSTVSFTYDNDGLLTGAGAMSLARDANSGFLTGTTLGSVTDAITRNEFGELTGYMTLFDSTTLYSSSLTRDVLGRVTSRTQTLSGETTTQIFEYDVAGRLIAVKDGTGTILSSYTFDANGNRTQIEENGTTTTATYDAQDRLIQFGETTYTFSPDGQLASKTDTTGTTRYTYDFLGNLTQAEFPSTLRVEYVIDAKNRRIGKRLNGNLVQGFLYQGQLNPVAELDAEGNVVSRFVYADKGHVPAYMIKDGTTYRFITDHLGSPRLIVNTDTGEIAQRMDFDTWGNVTQDTNPGFQPFGFAGGLYDHHTGLVRFGARDYDPEVGRWTSKDPIGFEGGDSNLYGYVMQDPVNGVDPSGLIIGTLFSKAGRRIVGQTVQEAAISGKILDSFIGAAIAFDTGNVVPETNIQTINNIFIGLEGYGAIQSMSMASVTCAAAMAGTAPAWLPIMFAGFAGVETGGLFNDLYEQISGQTMGEDIYDWLHPSQF